MAYLLDANVFIAAKQQHYGFEFCPAFWEWLVERNTVGRVFSIERVSHELTDGEDDLAEWATARGETFFLPPDAAVASSLGPVSSWVSSAGYEPAAQHAFLSVADYYLVATALSRRWTVVTHERAAASVKRVKIPNVCIGLNIKCMTPFEMLRVERARFVLGPTHDPVRAENA